MNFKLLLIFTLVLTLATGAIAQKTEPVKSDPVKAAKLPTVQEILAKYVKAIGGREAQEKIKTRFMTGTIEIAPMGVKGTFENYAAAEAKSMNKMELAGIGEFLDGSDGKTVWSVNPVQGSRVKAGQELAQANLINNFYREINLDKLYTKMELKGVEKVGGKDTFVIVATAEGLPPTTWYFDAISGLMLRTDTVGITPEGNQASKVFYDEFRTFDGVTIPTKVRAQMPTAEIIMTVTEVKHGVSIEEAKFAKPKQ